MNVKKNVLFCCTLNSVRSPMAKGILKKITNGRFYVDSVGVREGYSDGFMLEVMNEIGINMENHDPKKIEILEKKHFDNIISFSPEAHHHALSYGDIDTEPLLWNTLDPTITEGNRSQVLDAYRSARDQMHGKIKEYFKL